MGDNDSFIHSSLDDAGLSAAEFRVFCRIKRRGECTESVPNMAKGCRLNRDTVWDALAQLVELGMVARFSRPGESTIFRALPVSDWATPSGKGGAAEKEGRPSKPGDTQRRIRGDHPAEKEGHKVTPIEVTPTKGEPPPVSASQGDGREYWQLSNDRERLLRDIRTEREATKPNKSLIVGMKAELAKVESEIERRAKLN